MKITRWIGLWGWVAMSLMSCNKYLDVSPEDRFLTEDVFNDKASTYNALNGIYLNLAKPTLYGGQLTMSTMDVMAQYYNPVKTWKETAVYNYKDDRVQQTFTSIWQSAYVAILNTNSFLSRIEQTTVLAKGEKNLMRGEAFGLRAFMHFDLLRIFGPLDGADQAAIPYMTIPTEKIQPLLPTNAIIDSVLSDLGRAEQLLKDDPVRKVGIVYITGEDPVADFFKMRNCRFNYYAVLGLKARVLLYKGDKAGALLAANQVMNEAGKWFPWTNGQLTVPGYPAPDRVFSSEVIFGLQNFDLYNQQRSLFAATLADADILAPDPERLAEVFEQNENDYRFRICWVDGTAANKPYQTFVKYGEILSRNLPFRNFQPLLRLSELYYIAAECTTDPNFALNYLNEVRRNRGLIALNSAVPLDEFLQKEYRKEFWGEGQLFYYYKRKALKSIPSGTNGVDVTMGLSQYVVRLPLSELQNR